MDSISPWGMIRFQFKELELLQKSAAEGSILSQGLALWDSCGCFHFSDGGLGGGGTLQAPPTLEAWSQVVKGQTLSAEF